MRLWYLCLLFTSSCHCLSTKKGLCVNPETYMCHDLDHFTHINWWYDWTLKAGYQTWQLHCSHVKPGRIPMMRGKNFDNSTFQVIPPDTQILLGFNEPNIKANSNLMPQEAAKLWRELERLNPGKTLVGPATAQCRHDCNVGDAKEWYIEFFKYCSGCRIDYIATHIYVCDAHEAMQVLHDLWVTFHKPIWLTEFSCPQTHSAHRQLEYMKALLPQLEAAHYIHRYSWFSHRFNGTSWVTTSTNLVAPHSNHLTALGTYYNNF